MNARDWTLAEIDRRIALCREGFYDAADAAGAMNDLCPVHGDPPVAPVQSGGAP